ncbi:IucA/IucC family protein [Enhygromyxa salina]|uniref:Aerobactin synthase n=1 Tax=Enhygromyxa salina TaxID=215803 RepID=A0A2S9YVD2_9BACT|nr:IucA/IucC family protein [Enhygromyxa salina]PRQ09046.1 Aerobactin synthase [Enhygromyxa salina]
MTRDDDDSHDSHDWQRSWAVASARRLAQAIGELSFEALLDPRPIPEAGAGHYSLSFANAVAYQFRATPSAWGGVHVELGSVARRVGARPFEPADSLIQLLLDAREQLGASVEVLAGWFEEIQAGLLAESIQCERLRGRPASELASLETVALEQHLDGHPKLIAHRGRVGWGLEDLRAHAPESHARVRLDWLIVDPALTRRTGAAPDLVDLVDLVDHCCDPDERARLDAQVAARAPALAERGVLVPVHPWQWQRWIAPQFARQLGVGEIVHLGPFGDHYAPRLSLRTLANVDRRHAADLKLSLTILNTSCWRGLPGRHVTHGAAIGAALGQLVSRDPALSCVRVLGDLGGVSVPHPEYEALGHAPYRVRELIGAIWRTSAATRLEPGEVEVPAAALQQCDLAGTPLLATWVERSGATVSDWLTSLFEHTAVPLYHLLCAHGLGEIAHGQNLGLVLREGLPVAMFLRDFHGDLRRSERAPFAPGSALAGLTALPDEHLLHDLYTGYFVSVLRFVAPLVERSLGLREPEFLALLSRALRRHQAAHPELGEAFARFDPFQPAMARICLNRSRLRAAHGGGAQRPTPELGPPLRNPLATEDYT